MLSDGSTPHPGTPTDCSWCGAEAPADGSYLMTDIASGRRYAFCRLEHVVPWVMREGGRQRGGVEELSSEAVAASAASLDAHCSRCGADLDPAASVLLARRRAGQTIIDSFCGPEHLRAWASAGGRWSTKSR